MYTRSYYPEQEKLTVPEKYDGYAFSEEKNESVATEENESQESKAPLRAPWDEEKEETQEKIAQPVSSAPKHDSSFGGFINKIPFLKSLAKSDTFKNGLSDFGTEELLIIGIAIFLLLSKSGDKECSLMLLFLLFIK